VRRPTRILYVAHDAGYFMTRVAPLAHATRALGYEVHVATPIDDASPAIAAEGFVHHEFDMTRRSVSLGTELGAVRSLWRLYRTLRPDLVQHFSIKPVLYGGMVSRLTGVHAVVSTITGLGYVFIARGWAASLLRFAVVAAYRVALSHRNQVVIFHNGDDCDSFVRNGWVKESRTQVIPGSGVDMTRFHPTPEPPGRPLVVLPSRMLWDKGVGEFVEAARMLTAEGFDARFALVGEYDPGNPAAVPLDQLEAWRANGPVEWWGHRTDMPEIYAASHVVCLPSYREGLPKSIVEAAACGRAVVSTDAPGCRNIVLHGVNGLLVPVRDAHALAAALRTLLTDPALRARMGAAGREHALSGFSLQSVIDATQGIYRRLLERYAGWSVVGGRG
jgi:glycosyltransferase involved in cell wall biosynthesis